MSNKLKKVFGLDPEYNEELEEFNRKLEEEALRKKACCTCEYFTPLSSDYMRVREIPICECGIKEGTTCENYIRKGCALRNSPWADRIRERFMRKE